ncbi:ABC transporter ATP-binding protein [Negadavirga shengliensis]|uniref:ABC transporter ATP-binding protein n=1 Tax=Negadavirga shengliensis TaxID=1389218 RepID=A0ABV9SZB4_9BACT
MKHIKKLIARNFTSFAYFYRYLRYRIFIAVFLSIAVGMLDGFGLSMFLPLLQMVNDADAVDAESLGNLSFLVEGMEHIGISLTLFSVLTVMTLFFVFKGIAQFSSKSYRIILQQRFIRNMRLQLLDRLNKIGFKDFVTSDVGRIQNTMTGEVEKVSGAYVYYFQAFEQFILVMVYMGFAFFVDLKFALLVSIGGGLTNFLYKKIYENTKGASRKLTKDSNTYQGQVIQHVANFKYLKATGLTALFAKKLKTTIKFIEASRKKIGIYGAILDSTREPILIVVVSAVIIIQTNVLGGGLGPILISLLFFYRALGSLMNMQNAWNRFLARSGSLENVLDFQNDLERKVFRDGEIRLERFRESISLKDVSFGFGSVRILKNINLEIPKNASIAFVGESGSGKTTLVNLITGLLQAEEGETAIDGIPYHQLQLTSLQQRIGYITQEPVIFNDTVFNNITFWSERTAENMERFKAALEKASLLEFVEGLVAKEETELGHNGINLSGGQKQRISIARELFKEVDILIMDEATSALDSETEKSIQQNIDDLHGQYTLLIVAHRLSTIRNVDRIVLMSKGKIEEEGNFEQLSQRIPKFKRMVDLQKISL